MNKVILIGFLASDPEAYTTKSGISQSSFRLAVQRSYTGKNGKREADFFVVVCWKHTADFVNSYLVKGRKVCVEGSLQTRTYEAKDGSKRYITEIVASNVEALNSPKEFAEAQAARETGATPQAPGEAPDNGPQMDYGGVFAEIDDPELPFY